MNTIQLLQEKNHFLEKFYTLNENQLHRLAAGRFETLEDFYNQREDILKIIKYIDSEIAKSQDAAELMGLPVTSVDQMTAKDIMRTKDLFVNKIIEQDVQILCVIDKLKNEVIKELKTVRTAKKAMSGYKSGAA